MRRTIFLTSLKTALLAVPLLVGCGGNTTIQPVVVPPGGITLPDCTDGQLIAVAADRTMSCTQALTAGLAPPDCSTVANSALNAYDGILECMPKGAGGTNAGLKTIINKVKMDTDTIETSITSISVSVFIGMMLGARIGARLLNVLKGSVIRRLVIAVLLFAGARALLKGLGVWP